MWLGLGFPIFLSLFEIMNLFLDIDCIGNHLEHIIFCDDGVIVMNNCSCSTIANTKVQSFAMGYQPVPTIMRTPETVLIHGFFVA